MDSFADPHPDAGRHLQNSIGFLYQVELRHHLSDRLGVSWGPVHHGVADIAGVDRGLIDLFSKRRAAIDAGLAEWGLTSAAAGVNYAEIWTNTIAHGGDADNLNANISKTIRHEIGHTAGMWHPVTGSQPPCGADVVDTMVQGRVATAFPHLLYNSHHICHVNDWV